MSDPQRQPTFKADCSRCKSEQKHRVTVAVECLEAVEPNERVLFVMSTTCAQCGMATQRRGTMKPSPPMPSKVPDSESLARRAGR